MNRLLPTILFLIVAVIFPPVLCAQVSLEEYFDTKETIRDDGAYLCSEAVHANREFAESDAYQNLLTTAKAFYRGVTNNDVRLLIPKDKKKTVVCQRNGKYYVFEYCKKSDIVIDGEPAAYFPELYSAPASQTASVPTAAASSASAPVASASAASTGAVSAPVASAPAAVPAAGEILFNFIGGEVVDSKGVNQSQLAATMQRSLSTLLTEINKAYNSNSDVDFSNIKIDDKARRMFGGLWRAYPFACVNAQYNLPALCDVRGFQVRGIDITKKPGASDEVEDTDKELCVCFDADGQITCINFSKTIAFKKMYPTVTDKRRELEILQFIENFRCYYINHDLQALEALFSEDAIIITGKTSMKRESVGKDGPRFAKGTKYEVKDKKRYMESLAKVFKAYPTIDVKFDDIKLSQHPSREHVYAVNLVQTWNSKTYRGEGYSDIGYLHLLFDFPDHGDPRIHVRAWQPLDTAPKDIITIDSYDD